MKIRKSLTAVGAALMMVGMSAPALAGDFEDGFGDCGNRTQTYDRLVELAQHLRCNGVFSTPANPGYWPNAYPLWEKRRDPSCEVHASLAAKLYEAPEPNVRNPHKSEPVGAAQKVLEGTKDEDAIQKLDDLDRAIEKSKLNSELDAEDAGAIVWDLRNIVQEARVCVDKLP